jgi:hypothetical protein
MTPATMKRLLALLLILASSAGLAESGAYRVEIIVFRNLLVEAESTEVSELRSFSQFPDIEDYGSTDIPPEKAVTRPGGVPAELSLVLRPDLPDELVVVTEKSDMMDGVWRRLRSSKGYRPLVYAAWEQNRIDYYPPMRIHDQQLIDTQLRPPTTILYADLTAEDPLAAYRSNFYQLDGSLQLRRSRFLHLYLDLEYRERKPQNANGADFLIGNNMQAGMETGPVNPVSFGVFAIKQNRQISTGQIQYFDTPFFGALVYVTSIAADQAPGE